MQMIDVHLPTTDGRELILTRTTQPEPELQLLLDKLKLNFRRNHRPKLPSRTPPQLQLCSADLGTLLVDFSTT